MTLIINTKLGISMEDVIIYRYNSLISLITIFCPRRIEPQFELKFGLRDPRSRLCWAKCNALHLA